MTTNRTPIDRIVRHALDLRAELIDSAAVVSAANVAEDGTTTVQSALVDLRTVIDAFLAKADADREITGEQSTE